MCYTEYVGRLPEGGRLLTSRNYEFFSFLFTFREKEGIIVTIYTRKEEPRVKKVIYYILLVVFAAVFLVSLYSVGSYFLDSRETNSLYSGLSDIKNQYKPSAVTPETDPDGSVVENPDATEAGSGVFTPDGQEILPEYAQLYLMNPDLVGWITIPDTNIDYPVMQTPDSPDFYLKRDFNKNDNARGCVYVREVCDVFAPSDNLTLYGHCMRDGSMFANVSNFKDKDYWLSRKTFTFDTITQRHTYEVVAVFKTTATLGEGFAYHRFVEAENEAEFNEFVAQCKRLAFYDTGVDAVYGDKLICLSTCEYTQTNGRLVLVAKQIS